VTEPGPPAATRDRGATPHIGEVVPSGAPTGAGAVARRRGSAWEQLGLGSPDRPPAPDDVALVGSPYRFANRELSWLDFADRLLDLAADDGQPLLERVKFLAIFAEGLDEFFQVRVAGLEDQVAAGLRTRSPDGLGPGEQLAAITEGVTRLVARQSGIFAEGICPALSRAGILLADWHTLDDDDRDHLH